jgi:hypothetical protein
LIALGVLLLLDNLDVISIDWSSIWKYWPVLLIVIGIEIILGRRVSAGAIVLVVVIFIIGGLALSWSALGGTDDRTTERITWPLEDVERAELVLDAGIAKLALAGESDMSELLVADLDLAPGYDVSDQLQRSGDVARGRIKSQADFALLPQLFGGKTNEWDVQLNDQVSWTLDIGSAVGDVRLDLSDLRVGELTLDSGIGSVDVTLPQRGAVQAKIDGGVGDITVAIPPGAQARVRADQGIGDLNMGRRFEQHGDYYQTEGFTSSESFILVEIDIGIGRITVR